MKKKTPKPSTYKLPPSAEPPKVPDEKPDIITVRGDDGRIVFRVTEDAILVPEGIDTNEAARIVMQKLGGYVQNVIAKNAEQAIVQLQATCWQLTQQRDQAIAALQAAQAQAQKPGDLN